MVLALFSLFQVGPRLYQKTSSLNGSPVESGPNAFARIPLWIVHAFVDWFGLCFIVLSMVLAWFSLFRLGPRVYQRGPSLSCFCISRCLLFHSFVLLLHCFCYGFGLCFIVLSMVLAWLFIVFSMVFGLALHGDVYCLGCFFHGFVSGVGFFLIALPMVWAFFHCCLVKRIPLWMGGHCV